MKRVILYTFCGFTLLSCGGSEDRFRLEGEFEHLRQGEFYIYSNDGGTAGVDTLKIENGEFEYETTLDGHATYYLLYPNLSEQVIFGESGDVVKVKGDARNLKSVEVKGNKANEELTAFRLENLDRSVTEVRKAAVAYMAQSPESPVSVFLFREYFLSAEDLSQGEVEKHYRALCKAQPENLQLLGLRSDVEGRGRKVAKGKPLPDFHFVEENGDTVRASDFRGKPLLMIFWASWENRSTSDLFRIRYFMKQNAGKVGAVSISLDVNDASRKGVERMDSISWPVYCDKHAWNSPLVKQFDVRSVPYYILVGADGKVLTTGTSYEKDLLPELNKLVKP